MWSAQDSPGTLRVGMDSAGLNLATGSPDSLEQALASEIARAKQGEPLAPVAVLIGGTLLRPYLQRRLATLMGGIVNVHFITQAQLALALGEKQVQADERQPLPPLADRVLARQVTREPQGLLRGRARDGWLLDRALSADPRAPRRRLRRAHVRRDHLGRQRRRR